MDEGVPDGDGDYPEDPDYPDYYDDEPEEPDDVTK